MQQTKKVIALVLVLALCFGIVGCSAQPQTQSQPVRPGTSQNRPTAPTLPKPEATPEETIPSTEATAPVFVPQDLSVSSTMPTEAPQREELYEIIDLVGGGAIEEDSISDLTEEELTDIIGDLLENSTAQNPGLDTAPPPSGGVDVDNVTDEGLLEQPFDQLYPELMDQVEFSGESLTVKLSNDTELTGAMRSAGVAQLELLFDLGEASWYEAKLAAGTNATSVLSQLRELDEVLSADYNYSAHAHSLGEPQQIHDAISGNEKSAEQWYLKYFGITEGYNAMTTPGGSSSVVVAVIDTGVDTLHADLAQNIWVNRGEIPDNYMDDDGNGYTDDCYGYNFVSSSGNVSDDNGHGTHVAGIIAAQNNYMGTVGLAYNVKIMAIKALNHEGVTNDVAIIDAVKYAMENGAEVINMSFGQEAMSLAVQEVLAAASSRCVLVASAGNSGAANEGDAAVPNYPAALPYVLGVMSVDENGNRSSFSNYDVGTYNGIEYELYAPGERILSTIPGDRYASWSGTSMAAPMVSAMAALLRSQYADRTKYDTRFLYGQLTATSSQYVEEDGCFSPIVNLYHALTRLPQPDIGMSSYDLFDTKLLEGSDVNNGDGVVDCGETLALGLTLRNRWGASGSTTVTINAGDDPYVTIANPTVEYGAIGTYATADCGKIMEGDLLTGWEDPFYITVSEECPGDHMIWLDVTIAATNGLNPEDAEPHVNTAKIGLQVRNGSLLPTRINEDMTLKSGNLYIVYNATTIEAGVTVTVEPGAQIQFWSSDREDPYADQYMPSLTVKGNLLVEGTKENPVSIFPGMVYDPDYSAQPSNDYAVLLSTSGRGVVSLVHANVTNYLAQGGDGRDPRITYAYGTTFRYTSEYLRYRYLSGGNVHASTSHHSLGTIENMENCVFYQNGRYSACHISGNANSCVFVDCNMYLGNLTAQDCLFLGNTFTEVHRYENWNDETGRYEYVTHLNHYTSSYSASNPGNLLFDDAVTIHYRAETGTTYLAVRGDYPPAQLELYIEQIHGDYPELAEKLQEMTGHYAVIETKDEFDWLSARLCPHPVEIPAYNMDLHYDFRNRSYAWSDGTLLSDTLIGLVPETEHIVKELILTDYQFEDSIENDTMYLRYHLYEIPGPIYVTDIRLSEYNVLVDMESTYQIKYSTSPVNVPATDLIFESTNPEVATVDENGVVTPVSEGDADIYVYCKDRAVSNYISIHVREYRALDSITFAQESLEIAIGTEGQTDLIYTPVNTTRKNVTFTSSDSSIAAVDSQGRVAGLRSGTVTITATSSELDEFGEPITASVEVTVYRATTGMKLSQEILLGSQMSTLELPELTMEPADAEPILHWRSTDPEVANVTEDGDLNTYAPGITTIVAEDLRTGVYASFLLIVSELEEMPRIKNVWFSGYNHAVLMESGELYIWTEQIDAPTVVVDQIEQFSWGHNVLLALTKDNRFALSHGIQYASDPYFEFYDSVIDNIVDVQIDPYGYYYYALTEDGSVYYWHNSDTPGSSNYEFLNLSDVKQMRIGSSVSWFLTDSGELYYCDTGSYAPYGPVADDASMLASYAEWFDGEYIYYLNDSGRIYDLSTSGHESGYGSAPQGMDQLFLFGQDCFGILDGDIYTGGMDVGETFLVKEFGNAVCMRYQGGIYYAVTDDGLLYGWGWTDGSSCNHFPGVTTSTKVDDPMLIPMFNVENNFRLMNTNLIDGKVLIDDTLELEFSNTLGIISPKLYADGRQIAFNYSAHNENRLSISIAGGFQDDVSYKLLFPAGSLSSGYGVTNKTDISVLFTTEFYQTETELYVDVTEESAKMPVLNVSDWSELDLEWYITDETILSINEDHEMVPLAPGVTTVRLTEHRSGFSCEFDVSVFDYETVEIMDDDALSLNAFYVDEIESHIQDLYLDLSKTVVDFANVDTESIRVRLYSNGVEPSNLVQAGYEYDAENSKLRVQPGLAFEHTTSCILLVEGEYLAGAEHSNWSVKSSFLIEEVETLQNVKISCTTRFIPEEFIALESVNLVEPETENAALCDQELVLNFNKRITDYRIDLYELDENGEYGETPLVLSATTDLDQVILAPAEGFVEDKHYVVFLNGGFIAGLNAEPEHWVISHAFKYDPIEFIDTTIVRESVLDESVHRFYWTADLFRDAVNELHSQQNLNYRFTDNALLNRITTDTDVSHWMRILAPSSPSLEIPFGGNYWGTTDERAIGLQVIDQSDFSSYATIDYSPYLTEGPENTFPFVTGLAILDESGKEVTHLSNQKITVRITFNRDMDTEVPLTVAFGAEYPYNQYAIPGEYVDARTWEGRYILTTILPNGNHCFSISNGRSAEDNLELFTDWGRFGFELDTASAQALLMQGEATTEGVQLTWNQDDFDTLMGYNVYRSTGDANAYAQRINSSVIPVGNEKYLDTDVEPGVLYYYSFTVVRTDLSESVPSGKISIMSLDTMAPDLYHTPVYNATTGSNLVISATVRDNVSVGAVYVYYRVPGETEWNTAVMNKLNDRYSALIAAELLTTQGLEYYIEATDGISSSFKGSAETPYGITITEAQDSSSKGDVNGDGKINALDALMLLHSINGLVNLTAEQFERADLDGNGILQAMEALRILDYITGKVGSVRMN